MRRVIQFLVIAIFISISYAGPAWSAGGGTIDLKEVSIPKKFGTIKDFYQSPIAVKGGPIMIFHIQDVHANYQAQKNLADILRYLIETYGLELILVEGGITDKDFSYLRSWAPLEERKKKAEELLREGVISGETYVDIASDFPLKFQGIEDKALYEKNMELYLKVEEFRGSALIVIDELRDAIAKLKKYIYTRRLKEFDKKREDYRSEDIELVEYVGYLDKLLKEEGIDPDSYPNHRILIKTSVLEKAINFNVVERERDKLIKRLSDTLPKEEADKLVLKSLKFKEGKITAGDFYSWLRELALKNGIKTKRFKNIDRYTDYITTYEELDKDKVFKEIALIEDALSDRLCKNDEQKRLFNISNNLLVLESLLRLKLTPEDFEYYRENRKDFDIDGWKAFLKDQVNRFHVKAVIPDDLSVIKDNLGTMEDFYNVSFKRDEAFLKNSLKKMKKEKIRLAVLIAGGFHTRNLMRLFMVDNISYIVITPRVTEKTDDLLYDRILKESYETRIWE